jgi:hypothetical protein
MDQDTKSKLQAEVMTTKAMLSGVTGFTAALQQTSFSVAGPMVMIPSLPMAAQAIKAQNDAIAKLASVVEKILDAQ